MIVSLINSDINISKKIRFVFQASYKVEAKLLNAIDFPPLKRPLEDYLKSNSKFFGYWKNENLAGVVEIRHSDKSYTHIRSLVVDPRFFRQGIASELIEFVLNRFDTNLFVVETGLGNVPATQLYHKYGFTKVKEWDTDHGVRKVKFEKRIFH